MLLPQQCVLGELQCPLPDCAPHQTGVPHVMVIATGTFIHTTSPLTAADQPCQASLTCNDNDSKPPVSLLTTTRHESRVGIYERALIAHQPSHTVIISERMKLAGRGSDKKLTKSLELQRTVR